MLPLGFVMTQAVETEEALRNALSALVDGPGDPRSVDGVKVNALMSIAWSLIGLLAREAAFRDSADGAVSDLLERAGVLAEIRQ